MVDSGDRERVEESKAAFDRMIKNDNVKGIPLLVAANKQDLADCMGVREVKHLFENNVEVSEVMLDCSELGNLVLRKSRLVQEKFVISLTLQAQAISISLALYNVSGTEFS